MRCFLRRATAGKTIILGILTLCGGILNADASISDPASLLVPPTAQNTPANIRVSEPSAQYPEQEEPSIVVDSRGALVAAWKELLPDKGYGTVAFGTSLDGGRTWSKGLFPTGSDPWLAVDSLDRVYYAFVDGSIKVSRSDNRDGMWTAPTIVGGADKPSITADQDGNIYVACFQGRSRGNVRVSRSSDGAATWTAGTFAGSGDVWAPVVATSGTSVVSAAWLNADRADILNSTSIDKGETWSAPVRVNPIPGSAPNAEGAGVFPARWPFPSTVADRDSIYVAWSDVSEQNWDVVVSRSDDRGATWSSAVRINDVAAGDQFLVAMAIDPSGTLHAAWYDMRSGNIDVYYSTSSDRGKNWSPNLRITTQAMVPWNPVTRMGAWRLSEYLGVAADRNGVAYMVWTDWRDGVRAIYFARTGDIEPPAHRRAVRR